MVSFVIWSKQVHPMICLEWYDEYIFLLVEVSENQDMYNNILYGFQYMSSYLSNKRICMMSIHFLYTYD